MTVILIDSKQLKKLHRDHKILLLVLLLAFFTVFAGGSYLHWKTTNDSWVLLGTFTFVLCDLMFVWALLNVLSSKKK
jgi:hypothetical protein